MIILSCDSFKICYGMAAEILPDGLTAVSGDYIIAQTHFSRTDEIAGLEDLGFRFHDRCLRMEIGPDRAKELPIGICPVGGTAICETGDITGEMLALAYGAFDSDRRFFLNRAFEPAEEAHEIIRAYLDYYRKRPCRILKAVHGKEVLGFVVLCETTAGAYENVLGLTKQTLMGKAAAVPLYSGALGMAGSEGKRYIGVASTANAASMNLHMQLGAKVTEIMDRYILRNNKNK